MADDIPIDENFPFEPHAPNGRRLVTDQERIENHRAYERKYMAEKRDNPELYQAMKDYQKRKYHSNLQASREKVREAARKLRIRDPGTGKVRGILCHNCNMAIGCFHENATALFNAIEYLKR